MIERIFLHLAKEADFDWLQIDTTIVRAHKHAAGATLKKKGALASQGLGRCKGAFATKLHAVTDGLNLPLRLAARPGQENDMKRDHQMIDGLSPAFVLADRAFDANTLTGQILDFGAQPVIPPRRHRRDQHVYDRVLYKERNQIERFIAKLKEFSPVATRYDKQLDAFLGFVKLAPSLLWLK